MCVLPPLFRIRLFSEIYPSRWCFSRVLYGSSFCVRNPEGFCSFRALFSAQRFRSFLWKAGKQNETSDLVSPPPATVARHVFPACASPVFLHRAVFYGLLVAVSRAQAFSCDRSNNLWPFVLLIDGGGGELFSASEPNIVEAPFVFDLFNSRICCGISSSPAGGFLQ